MVMMMMLYVNDDDDDDTLIVMTIMTLSMDGDDDGAPCTEQFTAGTAVLRPEG